MQILKTLGFKLGATTVKEFLDRFFEEIKPLYAVSDNLKQLCLYIAKLSTHNYSLMQMKTSVLAVSVLRIALKIQDKLEKVENYQQILSNIVDFAEVDTQKVKECSSELLHFIQNFDKMCPNFMNIRQQYDDVLSKLTEKQ